LFCHTETQSFEAMLDNISEEEEEEEEKKKNGRL
jgi:hypothetical protein